MPTPDGLTIGSVIADSPADKAGLKRGDVVKSIDGTAVSDMESLRDALKDKKAGDKVVLSITRDGDAQDVTVTLEARPEPLPIANPVFPELNGIPRDELFSHFLGGSFQFTDSDGKTHTATVNLGTVTSVDIDAKKISVDLNSGDSKEYTITDSVTVAPNDLSKFESGDHVTIVSVDGDLRAVSKGMGGFLPGFGGMRGGHGKHDLAECGTSAECAGSAPAATALSRTAFPRARTNRDCDLPTAIELIGKRGRGGRSAKVDHGPGSTGCRPHRRRPGHRGGATLAR